MPGLTSIWAISVIIAVPRVRAARYKRTGRLSPGDARHRPRMHAVIMQRAAERLLDLAPPDRRDGQRAAVALARDPAQIHQTRCKRGADRAREMRAPLAEID